MTKKPANFEWIGFTEAQIKLLNQVDAAGDNGWRRSHYADTVMPKLMVALHAAGLAVDRIKAATQTIGYDTDALHQLERWESNRATGYFGG